MTIDTLCPSVFDAGLPMVDYLDAQPDEAHNVIAQARRQAAIALGPYGPEILGYDLVRAVLRDPRFRMPQGVLLAAQGITSGPVWDRVSKLILSLDGAEHDRLRRLVSKAFTPRATARLRTTIVEVISGHRQVVDRVWCCEDWSLWRLRRGTRATGIRSRSSGMRCGCITVSR